MACSDSRTKIAANEKPACLQCGAPLKFWRRRGGHRFCSEECEELKRQARARCLQTLLEPPLPVDADSLVCASFIVVVPAGLTNREAMRPVLESMPWQNARPLLPRAHPAGVPPCELWHNMHRVSDAQSSAAGWTAQRYLEKTVVARHHQ